MNVTNLELTQATIEIFGGFICLMLRMLIMMNGTQRNSWKQLRWMFFTTACLFFSEAAAYIFRGNTDVFSRFVTAATNFNVFFLNLVLLNQFLRYMYAMLQEKEIKPAKAYAKVINILLGVSFAILAVNLFTHWMYYFDEMNYYHRNTAWYVYTALNAVCIMAAGAMCVRYRKAMKKIMFVSLLLFVNAPLILVVIQAFVYGISITNIGVAIALVFTLVAYLIDWNKSQEIRERTSVDALLLFIIMTISLSASVFSCLMSMQRISSQNSESDSMVLAHMVSESLERQFMEPIVVAETMANDASLRQYMELGQNTSPLEVEDEIAVYLDSIRTGFDYQMVFAVNDATGAYYTYNGISKFVDIENDPHDVWYKYFLESNRIYDLDVDTDEANNRELSVFVNHQILDDQGDLLGACGVGVKMQDLRTFIEDCEEKYNLKIYLIDEYGLIQVSSDASRIEQDYIEVENLQDIGSEEFTYEKDTDYNRMTKYLKVLDWYLVVEDMNPEKIDVLQISAVSIVIFIIGLAMMGIVFFVMSTREKKASRELAEKRKTSLTDDMTGLFNRRAFDEDSAAIIESESLDSLCILMVDVNGLKAANDTYGHGAGDELIIEAAKCIQTAVGGLGKAYRTGGDEFVALLTCSEEKQKDVLDTLDRLVRSVKCSYPCELSIAKGMVICKEHPELTFDQITSLADKRMYSDKAAYYTTNGRDRRKR